MALAKADALRLQLNLKQLQRHDPKIHSIVSSTSYASVYENKGDGWVKTGVEGPMFLFARASAPLYGFFVLNRQGLEYIQEYLTPESEVKVEGEFILFEGGPDVDRATGIWVYEEKERVELCQRMETLRQKATAAQGGAKPQPPAASSSSAPSLPVGQPISLDLLFSSASPAASPAVQSALPPNPPHPVQPNPLDALFASASTSASPAGSMRMPGVQPVSPSPAAARAPGGAGGIPATLEQLFAAASPTPQAARLPSQQPQPQPASPAPAPAQAPSGMALLDSIFASAKQVPSPVPQAARLPGSALNTSIASPQPSSAALPQQHSPLPGAGSRVVEGQQQPGGDARNALLSMIGLSSPSSASEVPPLAGPATPVQANPMVNGDLAAPPSAYLPPAPATGEGGGTRTTEHPAPVAGVGALGGLTGAEGKEGKGEGKKEKKEKPLPRFAPPVLSHDIFDMLPLPGGSGGAKKEKEKKEAKSPEVEKKQDEVAPPPVPAAAEEADPAVQESLAATNTARGDDVAAPSSSSSSLAPPPAVDSPALPSASAVLSPPAPSSPSPPVASSPAVPQHPQPQPLLLSKADLLASLDAAAAQAGVGLPTPPNGHTGAKGPIEKEEFVKRVLEMVQKPSFAMQLYGRYLERWEETQEA
ncbi:hypothetical protein JCM8097_001693 [Rhodosporidiobolus ruineniae]